MSLLQSLDHPPHPFLVVFIFFVMFTNIPAVTLPLSLACPRRGSAFIVVTNAARFSARMRNSDGQIFGVRTVCLRFSRLSLRIVFIFRLEIVLINLTCMRGSRLNRNWYEYPLSSKSWILLGRYTYLSRNEPWG
jgi:hypothetical protein